MINAINLVSSKYLNTVLFNNLNFAHTCINRCAPFIPLIIVIFNVY